MRRGEEEGPRDGATLSACSAEDNDEGLGLRCGGRHDRVRGSTNVKIESETVKVPSVED